MMQDQKRGEPALTAYLRKAVQESGRSLNQLGKLAGVDHTRLSRFVRGERDLTLNAAGRLCEVLGLRLTADAAGGKAPPPAASDREAPPASQAEAPAAGQTARTKPSAAARRRNRGNSKGTG